MLSGWVGALSASTQFPEPQSTLDAGGAGGGRKLVESI
jgi:hypothetical protein